jgi:uncharacterized protein with GYD domain
MFLTDYSMKPADLAQALEARGFDSFWTPEHSHIPASRRTPYPMGGELPKEYYGTMDPFVTLTAVAMATKTLKVGSPDDLFKTVGVDGPRRLDAAKKTLEDMGGHFRSLHMTMGQFDLIGIYEAPDDAIAARYILMLGQLGNVRMVSMKSFPEGISNDRRLTPRVVRRRHLRTYHRPRPIRPCSYGTFGCRQTNDHRIRTDQHDRPDRRPRRAAATSRPRVPPSCSPNRFPVSPSAPN